MSNIYESLQSLKERLPQLGLVAVIPVLIVSHGIANAQDERQTIRPVTALAYNAATGALVKSDDEGLYRSTDEGQTWEEVPFPDSAEEDVTAIAVPAESNGALYVAGPGIGVLRTDDGESWSPVSEGLPSPDVTAIAAHSTQPNTVYAYLPESGIYRSQDAGNTWKMMDRGPEGTSPLIHTNMEGSMETGWLYAGTPQGVRVSMDCFCLWRDAGDLSGKILGLAYDPQNPKHLYAASNAGLFQSTDGGQEWSQVSSPEADATVAVTVSPIGVLYAATSDGGIFKSTDEAASWERTSG